MNSQYIEHVKALLSPPTPNSNGENENITNKGTLALFTIANVTRSTLYKYATISGQGNISFHAMSPFNLIDDLETNPQYAKKTVYVSVNTDPQISLDAENKPRIYNQNIGNFTVLLRPSIEVQGKAIPNPYNKIELHSAIIKQALIPADIEKFDRTVLNAHCDHLQNIVKENNENEDLDKKERIELNVLAYQEYAQAILKLYEDGLLEISNILINPKPNSIGFGMGLEDSMKSMSNPWLNKNVIASLGLPFSKAPSLNQYTTVVQILDTNDTNILMSDNENMVGKRLIYSDESTGRKREALSAVAIIKDYNSDTPILVNITDPNNTLSSNSRGRVEAFEGLLNKNINTFEVTGSLRPIVRTVGSNGSRNGNIFWELVVSSYNVYKSTNLRNSMEADSFADLAFSEDQDDENGENIGMFILDSSVNPTDSDSSNKDSKSATNSNDVF